MMLRSIPSLRVSASTFAATTATAAVLLMALFWASSPAEAAQAAKKANRYIGAQKCKTCHSSKETGDQVGALAKAKHSHAFEALATDDAKKAAKEKGIEDPQKADACVKCHETAFGVPDAEVAKSFDRTAGIQCESCHGPGDAHMKARMAAAATEEPDAPKVYKGVPAGELVASPTATVCVGCHNKESPFFKSFCECKMKIQIRHLNPKRVRTDAEKAALNTCSCKDDCACKKECCKDGNTCTELVKVAPK